MASIVIRNLDEVLRPRFRERTQIPAPNQPALAIIRLQGSGNEAPFARRRPPGGLPW